jgi:Mn2+/Fe2+ NRAMP family transporter
VLTTAGTPPVPAHRTGGLPAWSVADLPAPPPFTFANVFRVIGPGAILLATAIGGGEWLVGPAAGVKYGATIMGVATVAIVLQLVLNLEAIRYTLYTGEPISTGFMRLAPHPAWWGTVYIALAICQLGWPALALSSAATIYYSVLTVFSAWAVYTMRFAGPFALFKVMANVAGFVLAVAGVQILIVNRRFLPRDLRPPLYREILLASSAVFYGFFSLRAFLAAVR